MHTVLPFVLSLIVLVILLEMLATKLKIAYPILLVLVGLLICFIPGLPILRIHPDWIFFIFLPPLLFEAAWSASFKEMKKWWRIITSFAFLVVFFTALSVALIMNQINPTITIAMGFLLGGIVSPPDAVSTAAITRFVKIPKSTAAILEGESLLNDAAALIIFRFSLIAVGTGQFIWQEAAVSFIWMIVGGAGIGLLLAWIFVKIHKWLPTDTSSDVVITLIEPYILYWAAEQVHSSGVLAVVAGGLYLSSQRLKYLSSGSRIKGIGVWESFIFILNGAVFLIIGLELPEIVEGIRADGIPLRTAIGYGIIVTLILILARIISSYIAMIATLIFRPSVAPTLGDNRRRWFMPMLLGWTGMRGVVSLAAALAIPITIAEGVPFPHRSLIIFITFIAILFTLVIQGLTLPYLIRKTKLFDAVASEEHEERTRQTLKKGLKQHLVENMKLRLEKDREGFEGMELILKQWEERANSNEENWMTPKTKVIFTEMLQIQRDYLVELNKDPTMDEEVIRQQIYQLDLEEERIRIV